MDEEDVFDTDEGGEGGPWDMGESYVEIQP